MTDRELLEENNKMLKEILSFVRKVDSAEYRDHQDFMEFLRNVAADIWVEYMAFLKEAYPFNEETEVFIRKRYNMSIDVDPEEN